ncbi:MAG: 2-oxoacid:acceptor oxidoreductase subunit alpha, partial [Thermodesulfobacteriota bacterium]
VMAINDFESRIRGGHSFFQIRVSTRRIEAPHHELHLLVALDEKSIRIHQNRLHPRGRVLMGLEAMKEDKAFIPVLFTKLAEQAGGKIMANTVAAGACFSLIGAPFDFIENLLRDHFDVRNERLFKENLEAARLGFDTVLGKEFSFKLSWPKSYSPKGKLLDGAKGIALGALAADCRFAAFYPMSPATGIMGNLVSMADPFPVVVEQSEDELSAMNMIIGASFAGVRAMTATSGGGFCLMTEGLGLAAMTETPVVVVDGQRPGPSTGLPTRTGQGDLMFVLHASHDEFPRFVFAPSSPDEAYDLTVKAFDLADKYQVPAILLADQYLLDSIFTLEAPLSGPGRIQKYTIDDRDLIDPLSYRRFQVTESGVSPRAVPCAGKALVMISSDEHDEYGHISEEIENRTAQMNKRFIKLKNMSKEIRPPFAYHPGSDLLLVSWGSSRGAVSEAIEILRNQGIDAGYVHFTELWPFPKDAAADLIGQAKRFFMVEQNVTSQLGKLIRQETGLMPAGFILKYDGRPFYPSDILSTLHEKLR